MTINGISYSSNELFSTFWRPLLVTAGDVHRNKKTRLVEYIVCSWRYVFVGVWKLNMLRIKCINSLQTHRTYPRTVLRRRKQTGREERRTGLVPDGSEGSAGRTESVAERTGVFVSVNWQQQVMNRNSCMFSKVIPQYAWISDWKI